MYNFGFTFECFSQTFYMHVKEKEIFESKFWVFNRRLAPPSVFSELLQEGANYSLVVFVCFFLPKIKMSYVK